MDSATVAKLSAIFGKAVTDAATEMDPIYGPAIAKLGYKGLIELDALASTKKAKAAADLLHANMSGEELAAEKASVIGPMLVKVADDNAESWNLAREIVLGALRFLAAAMIPAVLL